MKKEGTKVKLGRIPLSFVISFGDGLILKFCLSNLLKEAGEMLSKCSLWLIVMIKIFACDLILC